MNKLKWTKLRDHTERAGLVDWDEIAYLGEFTLHTNDGFFDTFLWCKVLDHVLYGPNECHVLRVLDDTIYMAVQGIDHIPTFSWSILDDMVQLNKANYHNDQIVHQMYLDAMTVELEREQDEEYEAA